MDALHQRLLYPKSLEILVFQGFWVYDTSQYNIKLSNAMQIHLEPLDKHTIRSYGETHLVVDGIQYERSLIISETTLITDWPIHTLNQLDKTALAPLLSLEPEIILIGHRSANQQISPQLIADLSKLRIGLEYMRIGPACRTFNVLLNEHRRVVAGIIL